MKTISSTAVTLLALVSVAANAQLPAAAPASKAASPAVAEKYGKLPLSFEANRGQIGSEAKFISHGQGYSLFLTDRAAVLALTKSMAASSDPLAKTPLKPSDIESPTTEVVRMELAGASRGAQVAGVEALPGRVNYFIGNDPSKWRSDVPTYAKVRYSGVYPGIDLVYYGNQRQLEYDFLVAPGADAKRVRLHFAGADKLGLRTNGDLTISIKDGEIAFHKPDVYQIKDGRRKTVEGRFVRLAGNTVGFRLGGYDHSRELVIDPVLAYSTYLGGGSAGNFSGDFGKSIAVDSYGNAVVTGYTQSTDFPTTAGAYQTVSKSKEQVFVTKMNSTGSALIYSTYLGGTSFDEGFGVAVDGSGNAYVAGGASSADFPVTSGAYQTTNKCVKANGCSTGFITELNPEGSALVFSTYLGGSGGPGSYGEDTCAAIALDSSNNIYVTGYATSYDFPISAGAFQPNHNTSAGGFYNVFVTKLSHDGSSLLYSTYLGGSGNAFEEGDYGMGIAVDSLGQAVAAGLTSSTDFPTSSGAFQTVYHGSQYGTGFVTKFNADGTALVYSTFLGGKTQESTTGAGDRVQAVAVDSSGDAYVDGITGATNFPVTAGAFQTTYKASYATGFVAKVKPDGSGLGYATYLGGTSDDRLYGIAVDSSGNAYVAGLTSSLDFPVTPNAFQTKNKAADPDGGDFNGPNATFTELNSTGSALLYSTYLGGSDEDGEDGAAAIALDASNNAYLTGTAGSTDFPVTSGAYQKQRKGQYQYFNLFVAEFYYGTNPAPIPTTTTVTSNGNPLSVDVPVQFTAHVTTSNGTPVTSGQVNFTIDGTSFVNIALDGSGNAVYNLGPLSPGTFTIGATYLGVTTQLPLYGTSSATLMQTVLNQAATPVITPAASTGENPALQVQITSASVNAAIYYTTDGTTPTASSTLYKLPITIFGTMKIQAIAVVSGQMPSAVASDTFTSNVYPEVPPIDFYQNFASPRIKVNGPASIFEGFLELMSGTNNSATSAFYSTPVNIKSFTTDFTYNASGIADGFTFTIQNTGPDAVGGSGAGLGYVNIRKSVAIKFDIYNNAGEGPQSTGIYTGGNIPTIPAINLADSGINLVNNTIVDVHMTYDGAVLNMTITDLYTRASYSHAWTIDIPSHVGASTAYVGFTDGTGGGSMTNVIRSWFYLPGAPTVPHYPSKVTPQGLTVNGSAAVTSSGIRLTDGGVNESGSAFFINPVNIQSFTNNFTFQISDPVADGFTFTIQNTGPTALGDIGAGLGYTSIHRSAAIKFDTYNNAGEGRDSTGIFTAGNTPTIPAIDLTGTGIDLHSGHTMAVQMAYNGTVLAVTITDQDTLATWSHNFTIDLPATVGGNTAFVGFTGSTGLNTSTQTIKSWTYTQD